tara:strand:- start:620 stop:3157 length:2538 start_codon:yes stop_codon:yes gene_type:complete
VLSRLAGFAVHNGRFVIGAVLFLSLLSLALVATQGRINSDLGSLIRPSDDLLWYQHNEHYKNQFPFFEQTALMVVSGTRAGAVDRATNKLVQSLRSNSSFHSVFAPGVDEFVKRRGFYFLDTDQLELWLTGAEYGFGPLLRLADEASLNNFIYVLADHLSTNRGLPLPAPLESLVEALIEGEVRVDGLPLLTDPDQHSYYQLIVLQGAQDLSQQLPNETLVRVLREEIEQAELSPDVQVRLTGEIPLAHEEIQAALNGVGLAGLISMVLLALILGLGIRSWGFVLAIFTLLGSGVALTLGLAVAIVGAFNTLSLIFVVMFFGLGVDFAVHFGLRVREARQTLASTEALLLAAIDIGPALLLCMLTSSIAFLAFAPTAYVGLAELGVISAMGMIMAFVLTLTLLPALLSHVQLRTEHSDKFSLAFFALPPLPTLLVFLLLVGGAGWAAKDLRFDFSVLAMRDVNTEGMATLLELQDQGITTDYSIAVLAKNEQEAEALSRLLEGLEQVSSVTGPMDLVPDQQLDKQNMVQPVLDRFASIEEVLPAELSSPESLGQALDYLAESLPFARHQDLAALEQLGEKLGQLDETEIQQANNNLFVALNRSLDSARSMLSATPFALENLPAELRHRLISEDGEYLLNVQPREDLNNRDATSEFIEAVAPIAGNFAGRSVVEWGIGAVVVQSFIEAVTLAVSGIFILLALYFRSVVLPILVLVPVGVSLLFTFAICQLFGLSLNMANILVVPLIIGLGVDTGIHVVHRHVTEGRRAEGAGGLYESSTARAVVISALTTIGTFFSLSFSPHLGAASIGLLLTVAISLLVVVTFVLLPVLLKLLPNSIFSAQLRHA